MPFPNFNPSTGGKQNIDTNSRHDFALNAATFTVSIEAAYWGDGVDFQYSPTGHSKDWASVLRDGPVKRHAVHRFNASTGLYRFVTGRATGVVAEIAL